MVAVLCISNAVSKSHLFSRLECQPFSIPKNLPGAQLFTLKMILAAEASTEFSPGQCERLLPISLQFFFCLIVCDLGPFYGIGVRSLSVPNQPLWYCHELCRTNSCSLLAYKCVPHSKTRMWTCIQTVQSAARRQPAWIFYYCILWWLQWDLLSQIKTRHSPRAQELLSGFTSSTYCSESCTQPPEVAGNWVADIWAPKGFVSQYTAAFTLLPDGHGFTDVAAHFVVDGSTSRS